MNLIRFWKLSRIKLSSSRKVRFSKIFRFYFQFLERDNSADQIVAKDKLIDSYKTQADMMKKLISRKDIDFIGLISPLLTTRLILRNY